MNIYFMRHGETEENVKGTYHGRLEAELTLKGISQAERAGHFFKNIDLGRVYLSERERTAETLRILLGDRKISTSIDSRINEMNFGIFEGLSFKDTKRLYPEEAGKWEGDWRGYAIPEGESLEELYRRVSGFMEYLKGINEENILVVTHGGVIRCAYCYVLNDDLELYWKFSSLNGDISLLKYEFGNFYIDSIVHI